MAAREQNTEPPRPGWHGHVDTQSAGTCRGRSQCGHDQATAQGTAEGDALIGGLDDEITRAGVRGKVLPGRPTRRQKGLADCHRAEMGAQLAHAERLADALRYEPCSPTCANWLRDGVQPKNSRAGLGPGQCKGKAHRREHRGYAERRVLVPRKWPGKTPADHRADRRDWLLVTEARHRATGHSPPELSATGRAA